MLSCLFIVTAPANFKKYRFPAFSTPKHRFPDDCLSNTRNTVPYFFYEIQIKRFF